MVVNMSIVKGYFLKKVGTDFIIIPTVGNNVTMDKVFNVNEVGGRIFSLLSEGKSVDETIDIMSEEYDCPKDTLKSDVLEFVDILKEKGIYKD